MPPKVTPRQEGKSTRDIVKEFMRLSGEERKGLTDAEDQLAAFRKQSRFSVPLGRGMVRDTMHPYYEYNDKWTLRLTPYGDQVFFDVNSTYFGDFEGNRGMLSEESAWRVALWLADYFGWDAETLATVQGRRNAQEVKP